tara:strand:+ start:94 stop:447 length:354 start_codon:yes stop_codon:yes gene_type:complete
MGNASQTEVESNEFEKDEAVILEDANTVATIFAKKYYGLLNRLEGILSLSKDEKNFADFQRKIANLETQDSVDEAEKLSEQLGFPHLNEDETHISWEWDRKTSSNSLSTSRHKDKSA